MSDHSSTGFLAAATARRQPISSAPAIVPLEDAEQAVLAPAVLPEAISISSRPDRTRRREAISPGPAKILVPKKVKVQLVSLTVRIPAEWDIAIDRMCRDQNVEKTAIVRAALEPYVAAYLEVESPDQQ